METDLYEKLGKLVGTTESTHEIVSDMKKDIKEMSKIQSDQQIEVSYHRTWINDWDERVRPEHEENTDARKRTQMYFNLVKFLGAGTVFMIARTIIEFFNNHGKL